MKINSILIVAYDWPPRNSIAVHRPYAWARCWSNNGVRVTVLTAKKYFYDEPLDMALPELEGVNVVEVPYRYSRSASPSKKDSRFLLRQFLIDFLKKTGALLKKASGLNFDVRDLWAKKATKVALDICRKESFDVVVSTYGPRACHVIASKIKNRYPKIRWVADYRDLWSIRHNLNLGMAKRRREKSIEKRYLKDVDMITTVSEPLAENLYDFFNVKSYVVYNGFDFNFEDVSGRINNIPLYSNKKKPVKIVYTGMLYPDWQDPTPLFKAINNLIEGGLISNDDIQVHFFGRRQFNLSKLVSHCAAQEYVTIHGHVPREVSLEQQRNADFLLLIESGKDVAKGVLTGKVFEYMVSGTPILSIGSKTNSSIGELVTRARVGVVCQDSVEEIEKVLQKATSGSQWDEFLKPDLNYIKEFERKSQSLKFLELMQESL